jgi:hypothetical protein
LSGREDDPAERLAALKVFGRGCSIGDRERAIDLDVELGA